MSQLVDPDQIEQIVGAQRHPTSHIGNARTEDQMVYILHSEECRDTHDDLRECEYSQALDRGIPMDYWYDKLDQPVHLYIASDGLLWPVKSAL